MRALALLGSLWRGLTQRAGVEAEMEEEFRHHLALRAEELMRQGLPRQEASRRAHVEFGHVESLKEDARAARGLWFFDRIRFSWLDVKLGLRMLVKYPWLSLVSVLGMAVAIAISATAYSVIQTLVDPTLPLPAGERIVSIQNNTNVPGSPDRRAAYDLRVWREQLTSVRDVSAQMTMRRNLIVPGRTPEVVQVARMSPSGFRVAGSTPLLGRPLLEEDDRAGAAPVLVIAYEEWRNRFGGDPRIVGRTVRLGGTVHTIVGVMPPGFRFPVFHRFWVPLHLDGPTYRPGEGPPVYVFGRLADGATLEQAQAELATLSRRTSVTRPGSQTSLRPWIMPYAQGLSEADDPAMVLQLRALQAFIGLLLVVVALNVALLVYARTATRSGEIAMRTALGASRRRILTQLFAEALVLSAIAAMIGLGLGAAGFALMRGFLERSQAQLPFWIHLGLTRGAVLYTSGLGVLAGVIVGVLPGLQATGRRVQSSIQQISSRGSRMELGRVWTAMIVGQVAVAVAIMPLVLYMAGLSLRRGMDRPRYPAGQMLQATLAMGDAQEGGKAVGSGFAATAGRLLHGLEAEPGVVGVTFAEGFPGNGVPRRMELASTPHLEGHVAAERVAPNLFPVFDVPVLAGRGFSEADGREGARVAIVDRAFARRFLGGGSPVGHRVRLFGDGPDGARRPGAWLDIVGLVPDFTLQTDLDAAEPHVYQPAGLGEQPWVLLVLRTRGVPPLRLGERLRELAVGIDPALQVERVQWVALAEGEARTGFRYMGLAGAGFALTVLLLSAAGIYAMMSFTVARRRREIGIRAALGANPLTLLGGIFARAGAQVGTGVVVGLLLSLLLARAFGGNPLTPRMLRFLVVVAALVTLVALLAALGPARRSLAIQPTDALREE